MVVALLVVGIWRGGIVRRWRRRRLDCAGEDGVHGDGRRVVVATKKYVSLIASMASLELMKSDFLEVYSRLSLDLSRGRRVVRLIKGH